MCGLSIELNWVGFDEDAIAMDWIGLHWISFGLDLIGVRLHWIGLGMDLIGLELFFGALDGSGSSKWVAGEAPGGLFGVLRDPKPDPG